MKKIGSVADQPTHGRPPTSADEVQRVSILLGHRVCVVSEFLYSLLLKVLAVLVLVPISKNDLTSLAGRGLRAEVCMTSPAGTLCLERHSLIGV